MNSEVPATGFDTIKLATALALLVAGIVAFYMFEDQLLWIRVLGLLAVVGVALVVALQTAQGRSARAFLGDTRNEVRKVVWPSRAETVQTTLAVMFVVILLGLILWALDAFLFWAVRFLTGQGG